MRAQQDVVQARLEARVGQQTRVMIDGPTPESELVLTCRLEGQAPDIDAVVYLDECDPSAFPAGTVIEAIITGARGYDIVARPVAQVLSGT